jgi:hypothetical protein
VPSRCGATVSTSSLSSSLLGLAMKRWAPSIRSVRDITTIAVGDEVNEIPSFSMNQYKMYGEVVLAPIHAVVKHPRGLSSRSRLDLSFLVRKCSWGTAPETNP